MKKFIPALILAGVVFAAAVFWKSFYLQLESYERAVILHLGTLKPNAMGPGWHFRLPYPIQKIFKVDALNDRKLHIGFEINKKDEKISLEREALTLTRHGDLVEMEMEVNYYISDPAYFVLNVEDPELSTKQAAESAMRTVVGLYTVDDVLTDKKREIADKVRQLLQDILDKYQIGISIRRVQFIKSANPSMVLAAFENVENAKQDSGKAYLDAQKYANQKLPVARGEAKKVLAEAHAYADKILSKSRGDSSRFVQVVEKYLIYKAVTRKRMYLEAMEEVLPKVKKIIIDDKTKIAPLLPLGKM